ncbi:MAG TPA: GH92 family glycosyl hydrolase [Bryobacteraceae bacterium]|nr:GH92 family glycosyl hydrolase [Bryobacteraceae bacterium]
MLIRRFFGLCIPAFGIAFSCLGQTHPASLADLPDPLVGTDSKYELSHGNTYPGVFVPFGMIGWTPQTGEGGWLYQYSNDAIQDFLATHLPSAWTEDYGPFSLMPVAGELHVLPRERAAKFKHAEEDAKAYCYSVRFENGMRAEVTPSIHGGVLRFAFPAGQKAWVVLDASAGGSAIEMHPDTRTITGVNHHIRGGFPANFGQYFVAVFDRDFAEYGAWDKGGVAPGAKERRGEHVGAFVRFPAGQTVTVRVATSLISPEQALRTLQAEIPSSDFDHAAARARSAWERELGRIELRGGTAAQHRTFYTALYHAFQFPHALHETNAAGTVEHYSPYDGKVHPGTMYADTGFWDTFRAEFPLLALVAPARDAEIIRSLLNAYDEGGWLPKWPNPGYANVMIATHADSIIADAWTKGIHNFDGGKAYAALRKDATEPGTGRYEARNGIADYIRLGYVPADKVKESASCTLEYAYDDFCVSRMAHALGKIEDAALFAKRAQNYRNIYDPLTGFMRGRNADGSWVAPFDPLAWGGVYTEGNAWQWLWSAQQDAAGLISLLGGREAFLARLDTLFSMTGDYKVGGYGKVIHEMTEAKMAGTGQYAHINEPVHHVIYLYDYAGEPWKAQRWTHQIMDRFYLPGPDGWLGDEDTGQMSAWYIFSALGFYPVNPGQPVYALSSPMFDRAVLHLENGKTFTVEAHRSQPGDVYIQRAWLDGRPLDNCWIEHREILAGGVLRFELGSQPNKAWGTSSIPAPADGL